MDMKRAERRPGLPPRCLKDAHYRQGLVAEPEAPTSPLALLAERDAEILKLGNLYRWSHICHLYFLGCDYVANGISDVFVGFVSRWVSDKGIGLGVGFAVACQ